MKDPYRAQYDAQTLARAEEIKADAARLKAAQSKAAQLIDQQAAALQGLKKVAGKGKVSPPCRIRGPLACEDSSMGGGEMELVPEINRLRKAVGLPEGPLPCSPAVALAEAIDRVERWTGAGVLLGDWVEAGLPHGWSHRMFHGMQNMACDVQMTVGELAKVGEFTQRYAGVHCG